MTQVPPNLQATFEKSRGTLGRRVEKLEEAVSALLAGNLDEDLRANSQRDAHKLAGSLGMFGSPSGTELARSLEQALASEGGPGVAETPHLAELVLELRTELDALQVGLDPGGNGGAPAQPSKSDSRSLLLVSPDPELSENLSVEALGSDFRPRSVTTCADARRLVEAEAPDAAVLDVGFGEDHSESLDLLEELTHRVPPVPVLTLTQSEALIDRVEVARRGGCGFVQRALPARRVIDAVTEQIERSRPVKARVLAVDDDPAISAAVTAVLGGHGLAVTSLNDPQRFWELLESIGPDLLLLDLDMPGHDGIDLCQAVRADDRFGQLPIIFLTISSDPASVQKIFEAGADDLVSKPIVGPELSTRVLSRLERVRLYRDLAERDGLTGLPGRRGSTLAIENLLALADRAGQPASVAVIDLDDLKDVSATLGHATADDALRRLGKLLLGAIQGEDQVARWGYGEFVLVTYGMACDDAVQRVAEVLESFRHESFSGREGRSMHVTFSAGVAEYPRDGADLHELYHAADQALGRAKAAGDRVFPAGIQAGPTCPDVVVVEDDEALAGILIDSLETRGYSAHWINDGQVAMARLAGDAPDLMPSLVLLDVDLPGLDGLSVLRRLAGDDALSRTRVIMLTARAGETEVVEALELGAFDHVAKPFSLPVLMQRVRRALKR